MKLVGGETGALNEISFELFRLFANPSPTLLNRIENDGVSLFYNFNLASAGTPALFFNARIKISERRALTLFSATLFFLSPLFAAWLCPFSLVSLQPTAIHSLSLSLSLSPLSIRVYSFTLCSTPSFSSSSSSSGEVVGRVARNLIHQVGPRGNSRGMTRVSRDLFLFTRSTSADFSKRCCITARRRVY